MLTMSMDISRYAVDCVILEGRSLRAVAKSVGRSKSWVANQVTRFKSGIGRAHKGTRVIILIAGLDVRVISQNGELLRHLTFDPTKSYQPIGGS